MTKRIDEILELLAAIRDAYKDNMSDAEIKELRVNKTRVVARNRVIDHTTVADKFIRQSRGIRNTQHFDSLLIGWLRSDSGGLKQAIEIGVNHTDQMHIGHFFAPKAIAIEQFVKADLEGMKAEEGVIEGGTKVRVTSYFERNPNLRAKAIELHGTTCIACGFNFEAAYGSRGKDYIEVHHLVPLSTLTDPKLVNPDTDMVVLCSNCHRMVHRKRDAILSIDELKAIIKQNSQSTKGR